MEIFINKIKSYVLAHKFLVISLLSVIIIILIIEPKLFFLFFSFFIFHLKIGFTGIGNFFYCAGMILYIGLVIWAMIHIHKINSGSKTEIASKYPATQTIWFWLIIVSFLYPLCIFSYNP